jgi:hypothetical protein
MTLCEHLLLVLLTPRLSLALFLLESTAEFGHAMRCTGQFRYLQTRTAIRLGCHKGIL